MAPISIVLLSMALFCITFGAPSAKGDARAVIIDGW